MPRPVLEFSNLYGEIRHQKTTDLRKATRRERTNWPTASLTSANRELAADDPTTGPPEQRATEVRDLPLDMQHALSGGVNFSSADMPSLHGTSEITLEDVLSGAGLLEAVMSVEQDERPPPPSMMSDPGWEPEYDEFASPGEYYICDWGCRL